MCVASIMLCGFYHAKSSCTKGSEYGLKIKSLLAFFDRKKQLHTIHAINMLVWKISKTFKSKKIRR